MLADFLDSYHSIDASILALFRNPEPSTSRPTTVEAAKKKLEEDVNDEYGDEEVDDGKDVDERVPNVEEVTKKPNEDDDYDDYDDTAEEEEEEDAGM